MSQGRLDIAGLEGGRRHLLRLPVGRDLHGGTIELCIHVLKGARPGPTLGIVSTLHGDEWLGIEYIRHALAAIEPGDLSGSILALPVANPPAFALKVRTAPDESGGTDLNRIFPGGRSTLLADRLVATIAHSLLPSLDALLDIHLGDWGVTWEAIDYPSDFEDQALVERSWQLARALGFPVIHALRLMGGSHLGDLVRPVPPGVGTAVGYAGAILGIPSVVINVGGPGFDASVEARWLQAYVNGLGNVCIHLGMLDGIPVRPDRTLVFERTWSVRPSAAGILDPLVDSSALMTEVSAGQLLGRVIDPYTFDEVEELKAPRRGILYSVARSYPVQPGNWAFAAADLEDPNLRWIEG